jgi:hypothetical protein
MINLFKIAEKTMEKYVYNIFFKLPQYSFVLEELLNLMQLTNNYRDSYIPSLEPTYPGRRFQYWL